MKDAIVLFGESLWDSLPEGLFPGGAPLNLAANLSRLGRRAAPLTALGPDVLGQELLRRMNDWGLDTSLVQTSEMAPTGIARVEFASSDRSSPSFEIVSPAAWDRIEFDESVIANPPLAIGYGTLSCRYPTNRILLFRLFEAWSSSLRFLDLNLRPPHFERDVVLELIGCANLLKLNLDELRTVATWLDIPITAEGLSKSDPPEIAVASVERFGLDLVCVTDGARGAGVLHEGRWIWGVPPQIEVADAVGAGDAFSAGFLDTWLREPNPEKALFSGLQQGALAASRRGGIGRQ